MSGLAASGQEPEGHVGLVYPTAQVRDDAVAAFVVSGLQRGEQVVLATWDPGLESALAQHGVDTQRSAEGGLLTTLDAPHFYPTHGQAALIDPLLGSGRPGVRLVTSAEQALAYLGESGFHRVEQEMDDLCETRPVMLLCHLQSKTARGEALSPALDTFVDTHADELRAPGLRVHRTAAGVRLRGEVDRGNGGVVEAALARAATDPGAAGHPDNDGALVVDMSELHFLDVGGYRALHGGTEHWRGRGGTVLLTGARGIVRRVLELLGLGGDGVVRLA
jgi:anti-anti-sigma factor